MTVLKKIDYVFLSYLIISSFLMAFAKDAFTHVLPFILIRILILLAAFLLFYLDKKKSNSLILLLRYAYPLIFSAYFYSETVYYNKLFYHNIDPLLVRADEAMFGMQPSLVFSEVFSGRLFSELMYFGYFIFYVLIAGFTLYIFIRKRTDYKRLIFELTFSMYAFYLLFCLIPSAGPQFHFAYPENVVPDAYLFGSVVHFIQKTAEHPTGAFPSSHVGISVIILILSRKYTPRFFHVIWPFVLILILSTVYIKAHYVVDVIGGLILAPFILMLSGFVYQLPARGKLIHST